MKKAFNRNSATALTQPKSTMLVAGGVCALLVNPAMAVELGEIQVQSALGQPLRASIAFALAPNEQISEQCVYLRSARPAQGIPPVTSATTTLAGNRILLRGNTSLREPMMTLQVAVDCPYAAKVQREYLLLLNPMSMQPEVISESAPAARTAASATVPAATTARRPVNTFEPQQRSVERQPVATSRIDAGSQYRVEVGDTLSEIASRIPDRAGNLWSAVDRIFEANPDAFLNGDVNQLVAGSVLTIPSAVTNGKAVNLPAANPTSRAVAQGNERLGYNGPAESVPATPVESAPVPLDAAPSNANSSVSVASENPAAAETQPASSEGVAVVNETPVVEETVESAQSPDPFVQEPGTLQSAPAPTATVTILDTRIQQQNPAPVAVAPVEDGTSSSSWLVWLGGTGIAIFLALLLFGGRLRELFGGSNSTAGLQGSELQNDTPKPKRSLEATRVFTRRLGDLFTNGKLVSREEDSSASYEVSDSDSTTDIEATAKINLNETIGKANALKVEEDLASGNVLDTGHDLDVALDYSFSSTDENSNELDVVVDSANSDDAAESAGSDTDILATEVMPVTQTPADSAGEDDDYNVSMVLDVTKQNFLAPDKSAQDLRATQVGALNDIMDEDPTLPKEPALDITSDFDLRILEQDYEDELTAKMAVSDNTEEMVRELKDKGIDFNLDDTDISMAHDLDATAEITAEMPTAVMESDTVPEAGDDDETDLTEALAASIASLEGDIAEDDDTEVLGLESPINQDKSKAG